MQRSRSLRSTRSEDRAKSASALHNRSANNAEPLLQALMYHQQYQHAHPQQGLLRSNISLTRSISSNAVYHDGVTPRNKNIPMVNLAKNWNSPNSIENISKLKHEGTYSTSGRSRRAYRYADSAQLSGVAHDNISSYAPTEPYHEKKSYQQSELDASDDEAYMFIRPVDNSTKNSSISNSMGTVSAVGNVDVESDTPTQNREQDIQNALNEISDFQSNFVQKYNSEVANPDTIPITRIQQKILDRKELQQYNALTESSNVNSLDYNMRIQHETINSQYTLIRLRFNSGSNVGVLGFLDERKWHCTNVSEHQVLKLEKDKYLDDLWKCEMKAFQSVPLSSSSRSNSGGTFGESATSSTMYTTANTSSVNFQGVGANYNSSPNSKFNQKFDISMGETTNNSIEGKSTLRENEEDSPPVENSNGNLSDMAKNIHFD